MTFGNNEMVPNADDKEAVGPNRGHTLYYYLIAPMNVVENPQAAKQ